LLCEDEMRTAVELDSEFRTWEKENDVVKLLNKIQLLSLTTDGVESDALELFHSLCKVIQTSQGQKEDVDWYKRKFLANVEVLEHKWGKFYPTKSAGSSDTEREKARQQLLAAIFLERGASSKHGEMKARPHNDFLASNKQAYPDTLDKAAHLLANYERPGQHQHAGRNTGQGEPSGEGEGSSFNQGPNVHFSGSQM